MKTTTAFTLRSLTAATLVSLAPFPAGAQDASPVPPVTEAPAAAGADAQMAAFMAGFTDGNGLKLW